MQVSDPEQVLDRRVVDPGGAKIGTVTEVYLDEFAERAGWIAVRTGTFGDHVSPVPLAGAAISGEDIVVPFSKAIVKDAPHHDPEMALSREEEAALFAHYGLAPDDRAVAAVTGEPGEVPSAADHTTEDATRRGPGLHEGAGQGSRARLRSLAASGEGPADAMMAEALAADPRDTPTTATREMPEIDVTEPPVYADDELAEQLNQAQAQRAETARQREQSGY